MLLDKCSCLNCMSEGCPFVLNDYSIIFAPCFSHPLPCLQVDKLKGEKFAEQNGAIFAETSALSASNVDGLFVEIGELNPI